MRTVRVPLPFNARHVSAIRISAPGLIGAPKPFHPFGLQLRRRSLSAPPSLFRCAGAHSAGARIDSVANRGFEHIAIYKVISMGWKGGRVV